MKLLNKNKFQFVLLVLFVLTQTFVYPQKNDIWITTILREKFTDKEGNPLTGKGVIIGDVDSGIDIFHPMFFFADGGEYDWIDVNKDNIFTPGVDAVDLNGNGIVEKKEVLSLLELENNTYNLVQSKKGVYEPDMDFLYLDLNGNKKRDAGENNGFKETDPTYGEQLFISLDVNKNNKLDIGEKVVALKTSKVRAIREKNGTIRRRGIDLIKAEPDSIGHGTGVCGIICGGHYGVQKLHGFAPDAEIVMANIRYDYTPRFVRNFPDLVNFIRNENVNILLFEDGEWMWEFMDGSTEEEELVNEMARSGIFVVGGAGNLADGRMHIKDTLKAGDKRSYNFYSPQISEGKLVDGAFVSFLWRDTGNYISFWVNTPDNKKTKMLKGGSEFFSTGKYNIFYSREVSPRGTVMFKFGFSEQDSGTVQGNWSITLQTEKDVIIDGFIVDVSQSWSGSTHWLSDKITPEGTVTFPSTADSLVAVGAYVVNFEWPGYGKLNDLCSYSGIGYNITGKMGTDICAPGHTTFTVEKDYKYGMFSGTSAAAPHVVGTAALMIQYDRNLTHSQIRSILLSTAKYDNFTGRVPNTRWGYGKLNPEGAIKLLTSLY
ncbi:MAG: S8 family serine peptidase [Ignavibacteria bacterium]|nr:S8 family serine peptidase [Ignavibacteria bacterium]